MKSIINIRPFNSSLTPPPLPERGWQQAGAMEYSPFKFKIINY